MDHKHHTQSVNSFTPHQISILKKGCKTTHYNKQRFGGCVQHYLQENNSTSPKYPFYYTTQQAFSDQAVPCTNTTVQRLEKAVKQTYPHKPQTQTAFREFLTQRQNLLIQNPCTDVDTCALLYACQNPSASNQCTKFNNFNQLQNAFSNMIRHQ